MDSCVYEECLGSYYDAVYLLAGLGGDVCDFADLCKVGEVLRGFDYPRTVAEFAIDLRRAGYGSYWVSIMSRCQLALTGSCIGCGAFEDVID